VDDNLALKHHYGISCKLDCCPGFYPPGACDRALRSPVLDGVIKIYGVELVKKLSKRYEVLKLYNNGNTALGGNRLSIVKLYCSRTVEQ